MTRTKDKFRSLFLAALMVFSVMGGSIAFAGTAAAANDPANLQFSANNGGSTLSLESGGQTQSNIAFDVDNLNDQNSGQTVDVVVSAEDGVEFSSLNSVNTNVSVSSSGSVNNDGDIVFSLSPSNSGVSEQITLDGVVVDAPTNTGDYNLTVNVTDSGGSDASTTFADAFNVGSASTGPTGFLSGRISDQNNNDVDNATVRAVNTDTNSVFTTTSDSVGQYTLEVPAGDYDITVERQGFSTAQATNQTVTEDRTTTANLVIRRLVNPDNITVVDSSPIAVADGSDEASFTVEVTTEDLGDGSQPLADTEVAVSIASADDNGAVTFDSQTLTTDDQGQATVTLTSTEVQDVGLLFDATNGDNVTTTATASFIPQDGEGVFAAQVKDKNTAETLENATVYAVRDSRMEQNNISFTVSDNVSEGDEALFRVIDNDTGAVVDESDYKIELRDSSDFVRVDQLNESDAGVGSGFLGTAGPAAGGSFQFNVMPIEAGNYTVQSTTVTDDPADGDFSNVTGAQVTQDFTAETISERAAQTDANPVAQTTADGQATLTNLVADGKNGVEYTVIAQRADYDRQFQTATIQSYDTTEEIIEQLFLLEEREVEPNNVDITQVGVHPPLAETGGAPDPDQITPFDDTSDDTFQQVPRDGSVDVIEVSASATNFQGDEVPVDTNVTVGLNESFDGQFLNATVDDDDEVVSNDVENATVTVSTGDDGEATVLLETEQNAATLTAQKTATLETDSTVTDSSNVTFVGTVVYETGSLSGIVTNEDNEPLPNSVVYVEEFEDAGENRYTIEPVNAPFIPEDRQDALDSEFVVTDVSTNESVTVTGEELRNFEVDQEFTRVSVRNVSSVTLLTFPSDGAQYTLPRVPATDDGVTYTRVAGVQFATGTAGVGDSDPVRVGFTQEANIVIVGAQPVSAEFAVSDLNPQNVTVTQGDNITVTANVTNDGEVSSTQNVEFSVGGDVVATQTVSLDANETTTVTFENVSTADLAPGEYEHGVFTNDDEETATLTVEAGSGNGNNGVVADYDTNGQAGIQPVEAQNAIGDLNNGELTPGQVQSIIAALNS